MDAVTICAANYLPFAEVLGNSFLDHNSDSTFSILVIDSEKVFFSKNTKFNYLSPSDLDISQAQFENMAFYYNVTELATALKPSTLKSLFANGSEKVIYLDPDIQVFASFNELDNDLDEHSIVLTPHTLLPMPRDGLRPTEIDIMASGTFNLGFIGLSKSDESISFLNWWEERLEFDSISDPEEMLFTDQKWIDLVPAYFSFRVLRHPGYNVAYWNVHERLLSKQNEQFFVNDSNLKFFHFSGYRPEKPWILSKYVADNPRVVISENQILSQLCDNYAKLAIAAGWKQEFTIGYGYQNFESGKFIPSSLRRLYREDCIEARRRGENLVPPKDWQSWATVRTIQSGNLSRILFSIWKSRPDLKRRYPDATGTEANELLGWARTHGVKEEVIDKDLLYVGGLTSDAFPSKKSKKKGINVAGYLHGELGLGQSARLIYQSAIETGLPVTALNSNRSASRQNEKISQSESDVIYPLTISIVNADHFKFWIDDIGPDRLRNSAVVGVWAWEIEEFPLHMHAAFELVEEIWAVSDFVKKAIQPHTKKKILVFPTPIIPPSITEKLDRSVLNLPEDARYNLFIFDYMSVFNRKNPIAIVEAHKKAFPNSDGPMLVLKSLNGEKDSENREKLRYLILGRKDILLIEDYMSRNQLNALMAECEAYISLHRSEGYGLTLAEAMSLAKPVIATGYSGNLDFMNTDNSLLVDYKLVPIGMGSNPYDPKSYWAEPDVSQASEYMIKIWNDKEFATTLGLTAQNICQKFTIEASEKFIWSGVDRHTSIWALLKRRVKLQIKNLFKFMISFLKKYFC